MLYSFFGRIWEEEKMPTEWAEGHIVKLSKKSYLRKCTTESPYCFQQDYQPSHSQPSTGICGDFQTNKQESGKIAHAQTT